MDKIKYQKIILFFTLALFLLPIFVFAQSAPTQKDNICKSGETYCLNVPIGSLRYVDVKTNSNILGEYIKTWYGFLIGIAGILATIMIIFAGIKWTVSRGDSGAIGESKQLMISAITGLALIFLSYSILALINPDLLVIKMPTLNVLESFEGEYGGDDAKRLNVDSPNSIPQNSGNTAESETSHRRTLEEAGIPVTSSGNCQICTQTNCTCVGGTSEAAINNLLTLRRNCPNCTIEVTGSTEAGHHAGCNGNCVDIQRGSDLGYLTTEQYIQNNGEHLEEVRGLNCTEQNSCYQIDNTIYWFEDSHHIHTVTIK